MTLLIRPMRADDHDAVIAMTLRIWEPVFASVNRVVGPELAVLLHGEDWRDHQEADTRRILTSGADTWVAELDGRMAGFCAAAVVDPGRGIGEVQIVGVDPSAQREGVGHALVEEAAAALAGRGMKVAYISTGGDPGHAPARALYEHLGFTLFPSAQYFKVLEPVGEGEGAG